MGEVRRNQWGQYLVVPPGGVKPTGYVRATTVAKTLDSEGGLGPWKATAAVVGAMRRPGLHARWQALIAEHPDPWYGSEASKAACKKLVEECQLAGGTSDRADVGTALHAIIEQRNLGRPGTPLLQPTMQADIDAYRATIDAAGITFNPELLETIVVLDRHGVAGTADLLEVHVPGHGPMVADLKTGTNLEYSWQSIAIQLAIYANADNVYVQGDATDGSQDRRLPMPTLSRELGLVVHLPAGEARCELLLVDLVAGWKAFEHSMWTRSWRQCKTLARVYTPGAAAAAPLPSFDGEESPPATSSPSTIPDFNTPAIAPVTASTGPGSESESPPTGQLSGQEADLRTAGSAPAAGEADPAAPSAVTPSSPAPPPFDAPAAPAAASTGAPAVDPASTAARADLADIHAQLGTAPDDGEPVDDAAFTALNTPFGALDAEARRWVGDLTVQSMRHNVPFIATKGEPRTVRRFEILRGLVALATTGGARDEAVRAVISAAPTPLVNPAIVWDERIELGHLVGSLDHTRAAAFASRCDRLVHGSAVELEVDGRVAYEFPDPAANAA